MTKGEPFWECSSWTKRQKNTVRYAEEAENKRPVVGTLYVDKREVPRPYPKGIHVTVEPLD